MLNNFIKDDPDNFPAYHTMFPYGYKGCYPDIPFPELQIFRKIKTHTCKIHHKWMQCVCVCERKINNINHIINCDLLAEDFQKLTDYLNKYDLELIECLHRHELLGWGPIKVLCNAIYESRIAYAF